MDSNLSRLLALPLVAVGILGGALVGTSAVAHADTDDDDSYSAFDDNSYFDEPDFDGDYSGVDDYYSAFDDDYDYAPANEIVVSPDTYADPAPNLIPWGQWISGGAASAPQVDTTVQQSR